MREMFGDSIKYYNTATEMFKSGEVDCVQICTPHYSHPSLAIEALDNDLNVIVEKPAGVYTKQVAEMIERSKKSDKILGIMFNQRTNPAFKKMREMILNGDIGNIKRTNWIITDWYALRSTMTAARGVQPGRARAAESFIIRHRISSISFSGS